ncbi:MAG: ATP-binding protein [Vogesella sp.]|uniref:ATP-binding protein n=1 Tax=Vogesella sp. TaxID=1904252 RepID=UPI00391BCD07
MRWRPRDTLFTRLFCLVLAALLCSHIIMTLLFALFGPGPPSVAEPLPKGAITSTEVVMMPAPQDLPPGLRPAPQPRPAPFGPEQGSAMDARPRMPPQPPGPPGPGRLPPEFWYGFALQLVAVSLLAWYGARRLARPIEQLTRGARELGRTLDAPAIAETGPLETRQAARLFNTLQSKLRQQMTERSQFLAAVSHDLRTPLTRIRLRSTQVQDPQLQTRLNQDIDDMADMLNATLAYLRDNSQQDEWQQLDIEALLQAMAEDAQELGQPVSFSGHADQILTLPATLRRCLDNLLGNALRYGEHADILLQQNADYVEICIRDYGPGIPENQLARVLEPFVRLEDSRNRHTGGTGLGLTITRDGARRMGGELLLANAPQGGLLATLRLPR